MSLTPSQLKQIVTDYLRVLYSDVSTVDITFLVKDQRTGNWKVNTRFKKRDSFLSIQALLRIDENGDVVEFKEGWSWRY